LFDYIEKDEELKGYLEEQIKENLLQMVAEDSLAIHQKLLLLFWPAIEMLLNSLNVASSYFCQPALPAAGISSGFVAGIK